MAILQEQMELGAAFFLKVVGLVTETDRMLYEGTAVGHSGLGLERLHGLEPLGAERIDHFDGRQEFVTLRGAVVGVSRED